MERISRLFEANARRVWGLARSLTRTQEDADDLVQQAFTIAITKRAEIPDDAWPWLAKVVSFCARNHHRHRARRQGMEDVHETEISGREPDPAEAASKRELAQSLHAALGELSHDEREAVALCHLGGLSQSQACQIVGVELNTLKARVRRGLQHLQEKLGLSEASASAFLASFTFPPPADGWNQAITRWESGARDAVDAPPSPQPAAALKIFGLAALASLAGAGIWLALYAQNAGVNWTRGQETATSASTGKPGTPPDAKSPGGESSKSKPASRDNTPAGNPTGKPDVGAEPTPEKPATPENPAGDARPGSLQIRTTYYANGRIELQWTELVTPGKAVKQGTLVHNWPNGNVRETGEFQEDLREGLWIFRYEDNVKSTEGEFLHGKPHGLWKTYDEKGNPESEGRYENGQHVGEWRTLHPNGQKALLQNFVQDKLNGLETEFDDHGRKRRETQWVNNKRHGWEIRWNEAGEEISRKLFHQGK